MSDNPNAVRWDDAPEFDRSEYYPILTPKGADRLRGYILSHRAIGCWTHFADGRTHPCTKSSGHCKGCEFSVTLRWRGYVWALVSGKHPLGMLELTEGAFQDAQRRWMGLAAPIQRCAFCAYRRNGWRNGKLIVEVADAPDPRVTIPDLPDLRANLLRFWAAPGRSRALPSRRPVDDGPGEDVPLPGL